MTTEQKIIRHKIGLLELAKQLGNVSQACKILGSSRDSFYRFKELYDTGGEEALRRSEATFHSETCDAVHACDASSGTLEFEHFPLTEVETPTNFPAAA